MSPAYANESRLLRARAKVLELSELVYKYYATSRYIITYRNL